MIFSSLGGLRSTAVTGSNFPGGKTIVTNDEMRGLLDENLLSPIHSSELNSPTTGGPSQTWLEVARKHHKQKFKESVASGKTLSQAEDNKWETIETQVVYDNGSKETILATDNYLLDGIVGLFSDTNERCITHVPFENSPFGHFYSIKDSFF